MLEPLRIFVGYDPVEAVAYHVLCHSILTRASKPVSITPIYRPHLKGVFTRPRGPKESTDFSISRFLTPALAGYVGMAIFMDCDFLCRADIVELETLVHGQPDKAVFVAPHDYTPRARTKFLGNVQTVYPKKNWSSLMVFNLQNMACKDLTPEYVNTATPKALHQFEWVPEGRVGTLPLVWNWLVGEYRHNPAAKQVHFTEGGPWHGPEYEDVDYADEWRAELTAMTRFAPALV